MSDTCSIDKNWESIIVDFFDSLAKEKNDKNAKNKSEKYNPNIWLSENSKKASNVFFATHVSSLTHSRIKTPSINDQSLEKKTSYLTTSSLANKILDGALSSNEYSTIYKFLILECNGVKLIDEIFRTNSQVLKFFTKNDDYKKWGEDFKKTVYAKPLSGHLLSKQIYYPTNRCDNLLSYNYHLLSIMKSSSLAHKAFEAIKKSQKDNKNKNFSFNEVVSYPKVAKISVTASNHGNASQLNIKRNGKLLLFSSAPPNWAKSIKPPTNQKSYFNRNLKSVVDEEVINYLSNFITRNQSIGVSIKSPKRKKWVIFWVTSIIGDLLTNVSFIQNLEPGWSAIENIKLKREHQFFLDPYSKNEIFQHERNSQNWQEVICEDFSYWLNKVLIESNKLYIPQKEHLQIWQKLMKHHLRLHEEAISINRENI